MGQQTMMTGNSAGGAFGRHCHWDNCTLPGIYPILESSGDGGTYVPHNYCSTHYGQMKAGSVSGIIQDASNKIEYHFGKRYRDVTLESFISDEETLREMSHIMKGYGPTVIKSLQEAHRASYEFLDEFLLTGSGSLFLGGPPGCGKTTLEAGIARKAIEAGKKVIVKHSNHLVRDIRSTYRMNASSMRQSISSIIESVKDADLVILEDLQPSCFKDDIRPYIHEIIDQVYIDQRGLVISANLTLKTLREEDRLGRHLVDRIMEPPAWQIEFPPSTPSWRVLTKRAEELDAE